MNLNQVSKRKVSILIPYYTENEKVLVFLQKRAPDAKRLPGFYGFFGGGIEIDESIEAGLEREIKEELGINISGYSHFAHYEFYGSIMDVFTIQVDKDFPNKIIVNEGEYGKFFSYGDVLVNQQIINQDKLVLTNFFGQIEYRDPYHFK